MNIYQRYTLSGHIRVDMDLTGLFCELESEKDEDVYYQVRVDESGSVPVAVSCSCPSRRSCKHRDIVNLYYAHIYRRVIAKKNVIVDLATAGNLPGANSKTSQEFLAGLPSIIASRQSA